MYRPIAMGQVVLRSNGRLSSLGWMALGFFFGFPFIAVGLAPGGKLINLFVGVPVFLLFFALALWDLGHSTVLVLDPLQGRGLFLHGLYQRRTKLAFGLREVARLVLVKSLVGNGGRHSSRTTYFDLRLELRDGRSINLQLQRHRAPEDAAIQVGRALGLRVEQEMRTAAAA